MVRTGIPVSVWEKEDPAVMQTALRLILNGSSSDAAAAGDVLIAGGDRG